MGLQENQDTLNLRIWAKNLRTLLKDMKPYRLMGLQKVHKKQGLP